MLVSVLMSVYNGEGFLREAIDSILNQTYSEFEFIIIDDGSSDNSINIIKAYGDERIKLIQNEMNMGLTKSLNKGIDISKGKYIVRMDADDISLPNRIETQVKFMEKNVHIGICGSARIVKKNNSEKIYNNKVKTPLEIKAHLTFGNCIAHPTVIIRKDLLNKFNLRYNEEFKYAQDYELWSRAVLKFDIANIKEPLLIYREHENQIAKTKLKEQNHYANLIKKELSRHFSIIDKVRFFFIYLRLR